jgi:hypothetical protein
MISDAKIAEMLLATAGIMSTAAARLGVNKSTICRRVQRSPVLQQALADASDRVLDLAETELFKSIQAGESWAVCFYLKCKGKHRGYVERSEITGAQGVPVMQVSDSVPDTELDKILNGT